MVPPVAASLPVDRGFVFRRVLVTRDERHRGGVRAVCHRDAGDAGSADGGGDAGHDLEGDVVGREMLHLLAATPEDERVPALQADDGLALACEFDEAVVGVLL